MKEAVIVAYGRSAIAKARKGSLANEHPVDYSAEVLNGVLDRVKELDPKEIDDIIVGVAYPEKKQGHNMARIIAQRAGIPDTVSAQTINRFCSSGLQSIATAANAIMADQADVIVAGGVEAMTHINMLPEESDKSDYLVEIDSDIYLPMGMTAENVAAQRNISREDMDRYAVESHHKAQKSQETGVFEKEIIPVTYTDAEGKKQKLTKDESIRYNSTVEGMQGLKSPFKEDGVVTAGTSSPMNDAAAFVVVMSLDKARELGIKPIAKFVGFQTAGLDPAIMGLGPVHAIPKVMERSGLTLDEMDSIEFNEAFAAQVLGTIDELGLDVEKVNPRGGALALGHPLGASGAVLTSRLLNYLEDTDGKYGLVTMCIGGGMGAAGIFEMMSE